MDTPSVEEIRPLIFNHSIPSKLHDVRLSYEKQVAVYIIMASTLFERAAFYLLAANIVLVLKSREFGWSSTNSEFALYIFSGTTYVSTIIFAVMSDSILGRAKTIIIGFIPYFIGYILIILNLHDKTKQYFCHSLQTEHSSILQENCAPSILGTLICTAIGAGIVQSNMAVFGAEQIQELKITSRYFDKYMVAVNIGSIIAILIFPYIQKESGHYYIGYIVAAALLLLAAVLFIIGRRYYIYIDPYDTVIMMCIPVVINACQSWRQYKKSKHSTDKDQWNSVSMNLISASTSLTRREELIRIDERPATFLDFAKAPNNGKFHDRIVDNVKSLRGAFVVFILLIPYWLIYDQLDTTFPLQRQQMDTSDGQYMITLMFLGDPITIIIGILILNMFVYKYLDTENPAMEITTKFVIGMCFASITMCITGVVEGFRQDQCKQDNNQSILSIYAQLPQNIFMGLSELFATMASYEYAYFAAPRSAQALFMSLCFVSVGVSSFIGSIYINFFPNRDVAINFECISHLNWQWSFYTYFFILAVLQLIFIIILILCQKKFQIIKLSPEKMEHREFVQYLSNALVSRS